ncbi:MAG: ThuA domain-containing protein, partial [Verrucomicrobiota bacterium]
MGTSLLKTLSVFLSIGLISGIAQSKLKSFELTPEWEAKITELAPDQPTAKPLKERNVLIFSLTTGFKHWCIPHTDAVVTLLGKKTGAYQSTVSTDIEVFKLDNLKKYDAVVLNNTCPDRKDRDTFRDVLINKMSQFGTKYKDVPLEEREALAKQSYENLVQYVSEGGGLVLLHGAITSFNNSEEFSALAGGSFDYHPPQQEVILTPTDDTHPLLLPFEGKPFTHIDEPYILKNAYSQFNFRPLLEMETTNLKDKRLKKLPSLPRYVAWIKPYNEGRVFFCSPSHNAQSFE